MLDDVGVGVAEIDQQRGRYGAYAAAMEQAAYDYTPGNYDGPVALFQPTERAGLLDSRPGWAEVVSGPLELHNIPGSHWTMLTAPNVASFAVRLREAIERVLPAGPAT